MQNGGQIGLGELFKKNIEQKILVTLGSKKILCTP